MRSPIRRAACRVRRARHDAALSDVRAELRGAVPSEPERSSESNPSDEENSRGPVNGLVAARVRERSERAGKTFEKRSGDMGPNTSGCIRWRPTTPAPCAAEVARKLSSDRVMTWSARIERS